MPPRRPGASGTTGVPERFESQIVGYAERRVEIETVADRDALLVFLDANTPGWTASVTGAPAPIFSANVAFRAVPIPAGRQRVVFTFRPPHWYLALAVTTVATISTDTARP